MLTEVNRLCSDQQALTASGVSEAILDNVRESPVYDGRLHFIVSVTDKGAGGTSIRAQVQTTDADPTAGGATWTTIADTGVVAVGNIPDNGVILDETVSDNWDAKRYLRVNYTLAGTFSTPPKVTAGEFTEGAPRYRRNFTPGAGFSG